MKDLYVIKIDSMYRSDERSESLSRRMSGKNLRPARPSGAGGRESSRDSFPPGTSLKHSYLVHLKETSMRE